MMANMLAKATGIFNAIKYERVEQKKLLPSNIRRG
jgi:predicted outer membrane lipoprotein